MVRKKDKVFIITRGEAIDLLWLLSVGKTKLKDKEKTLAKNYWEKFCKALGLITTKNYKGESDGKV